MEERTKPESQAAQEKTRQFSLQEWIGAWKRFSPDFMAGGREFHEQKERDWGGVFGSDPADADESPKSTDGV